MTSASTALVPVFSGTLASHPAQLCNARDLHAFMGVKRDFSTWIKSRIEKYGFQAGADYLAVSRSPELGSGNRGASIEYSLSLDMAKELGMVENNDKGRTIRRYFIECERTAKIADETPRPGAKLSPRQAFLVKQAVEARANGVKEDVRAKTFRRLWGAVYAHFKVPAYRDIPAASFDEALSLVARLPLWEKEVEPAAPALIEQQRLEACTTFIRAMVAGLPVLPGQQRGENMRYVTPGDMLNETSPSLRLFMKLEDVFGVRLIEQRNELRALKFFLAELLEASRYASLKLDLARHGGLSLKFA